MKKVALTIMTAIICLAASSAWAGPYDSTGYTSSDFTYVEWASSVEDYSGYNASTVYNILGELDKTLAVGAGEGGYITVGFDTAVTDGSGVDFVIWENGFEVNGNKWISLR